MTPLRLALLLGTLACFVSPVPASDADQALNENYRALMQQLDKANQTRLREAQRAWLVFRDKECLFKVQGQRDATNARVVHDSCLEALAGLRAEQLKQELECDPQRSACVVRRSATAASAATAVEQSCSQEIGAAKAKRLVAQCLEVSPATHPPCNAANTCALITDEIRRGCELLDQDGPKYCADYR